MKIKQKKFNPLLNYDWVLNAGRLYTTSSETVQTTIIAHPNDKNIHWEMW